MKYAEKEDIEKAESEGQGMTAGVLVITFIIGALIGYLVCMTQWIMQMEKDSTSIGIEIAKIKVELGMALREEGEDEENNI